VVIKVLKQQQQQQKPKLQPAQAPLQPFDVIPSQQVSWHSLHLYKSSTRVRYVQVINQSPICTSYQPESASVVFTFEISSETLTLTCLDHAGLRDTKLPFTDQGVCRYGTRD